MVRNKKDQRVLDKWLNQLSEGMKRNYKPKIIIILDHFSIQTLKNRFKKGKDVDIISKITQFDTTSKKLTAQAALVNFARFAKFYDPVLTEQIKDINENKVQEDLYRESKHYDLGQLNDKFDQLQLNEDSYEPIVARLLFDLYLNYPPLRSDYFLVKFRNFDTTTDKYFNKSEGVIVINRCLKTNKKIQDIKLQQNTIDLIHILTNQPDFKGDYILPMGNYTGEARLSNGKPTKYMSKYSLKYLDIKLTINDFRKIAVSKMTAETSGLPTRQRIQQFVNLSSQMGHSFQTQQQHYTS